MPNWCENVLIIKGDAIDIAELLEVCKGEKTAFTFENVSPTPKELLEEGGWYDWRITNWGTKWDAFETAVVEISDTETEVWMDTAWSPPTGFVLKLSELYPFLDFTLKFEESMCDFSGEVIIKAGELIGQSVGQFRFVKLHDDDWYSFFDDEDGCWIE